MEKITEQLMTLCESCAEKLSEKYILTELGWAPGCCSWMGCGNLPAKQYRFESKAAIRQRQQAQRYSGQRKDTRAYYRGRWRET